MSTRDLRNVVRYGWEQLEQEEGATGNGNVVAGHLVEEDNNNDYTPHSSDGGAVNRPLFAKDMRGRGYEAGDGYPDGEWISVVIPNAGVELTAILAAGSDLSTASNANISEGDRLVSAGDGTLRAFDADDPDDVVAVAEESKDNSGAGAGETALLGVEVVR
jgi:hypothetical protein